MDKPGGVEFGYDISTPTSLNFELQLSPEFSSPKDSCQFLWKEPGDLYLQKKRMANFVSRKLK